jgi:hypothetical protein
MRGSPGWLLLLAVLFAFRLTHREILWVEEAYPSAAAIQMLQGRSLYTDFQYDKPPLSAAVYLLWAGQAGWPLRLAGACYVTLCCFLAYLIARHWWTDFEGRLAALLLGFYLTFGIPAAVMALAPDLLTLLPVLAAMLARAHERPRVAGLCLGLAVGFNGKALLLAPLLGFRGLPGFFAGITLPLLFVDLPAMWDQVWRWGAAYSRDTPLASPVREGLVRTLAWCGFQSTAVAGAVWCCWRERSRVLLPWLALSLVMVCLGLRFSPRYYLVLLPPLVLAGARGLALMPARVRWGVLALLLIPAGRFGPRLLNTADWADTAMNRDSAAAARWISGLAKPGDTILVWGYRPDILVYTRLPLGAPFLDSQPLTGVIADRHLTQSKPTFPELATRNRARLAGLSPTWIVDGLGPYNRDLAISNYPDLQAWLARYAEVQRTAGTRIYRLRR